MTTVPRLRSTSAAPARVPDPSTLFWATKAASTALGEAVSDFSIRVMPPVLAVLLGFALFVAALVFQLTRRRYIPEVYWLAVAMVGVFGTMAADVVHVVLGLPVRGLRHAVRAAARRRLRLLVAGRAHPVGPRRHDRPSRAVLLGGGRRHLRARHRRRRLRRGRARPRLPRLDRRCSPSLILIPALGYRFLQWNAVFAFWFAYVLTRPLGASVADWLGKPVDEGGVGIGSGWVSLAFAVVMIVLVLVIRRRQPVADRPTVAIFGR